MSLFCGYESSTTTGTTNLDYNGFTMKRDINMGDNEIRGLGDPTTDTSAVNKKWVDSEIIKGGKGGLSDTGFTMKGNFDMGGYDLSGLNDSADPSAAASQRWVGTEIDSRPFPRKTGGFMTGGIDMGDNEIKSLGRPTTEDSAVAKSG